VQANSQKLRNQLCRLDSPIAMAKASSHMRNFAVAELVGYIAFLDGHPNIVGRPVVRTGPAQFQQARGTVDNPFAHVVPCAMLLNGDKLVDFYQSLQARQQLERAFGMGVMAPDDWAKQGTFKDGNPIQHNIVDSATEGHHRDRGLVAAFGQCGEAAVNRSVWDASGNRVHNLGSLGSFIDDIYGRIWIPAARSAYTAALSHYGAQLSVARNTNPQRLKILELRRNISEAQYEAFEQDKHIAPEAALNIWKSTVAEKWT
jgi:hypothetical protein